MKAYPKNNLLILILVLVVQVFLSSCGENSTENLESPKKEPNEEPKKPTAIDFSQFTEIEIFIENIKCEHSYTSDYRYHSDFSHIYKLDSVMMRKELINLVKNYKLKYSSNDSNKHNSNLDYQNMIHLSYFTNDDFSSLDTFKLTFHHKNYEIYDILFHDTVLYCTFVNMKIVNVTDSTFTAIIQGSSISENNLQFFYQNYDFYSASPIHYQMKEDKYNKIIEDFDNSAIRIEFKKRK